MATETSAEVLTEQVGQVFATSPIGMGLIGPDGTWMRVNRSLARLDGVIEAEMNGGSPLDHLHPDDRDLVNRFAVRALRGRPAAVDHRVVIAGGEVRWHRTQLTKISTPGSPALLVQTAERRSDVETQALDRVTGVLSQKGIAAEVEHTVLVSRRSHDGFALICVDVDGFRRINDRLSVHAADRLLEYVGIRSRQDTKRTLEPVQRALQTVIPLGESEPISCRLGDVFVDGCDVDPYDLRATVEQATIRSARDMGWRFRSSPTTMRSRVRGNSASTSCRATSSARRSRSIEPAGLGVRPSTDVRPGR